MAHVHYWVIEPTTDATHDYWRCSCGATKTTPRYIYVPHYDKPTVFLDNSLVDIAKQIVGR